MTSTDSNQLTRFLLPAAGVRGVRVHLGDAWARIRDNGQYPPAVAALLGHAVAASALFTAHTKVDGRLSVQLRGSDALRTLFAECTAGGTVRGIVQLADDADPVRADAIAGDLRQLGEGALLVLTIENPGLRADEPQRYQGVVPVEHPALADAFEQYFRQSEQLPTRLLLATDGTQAAGLMLQKLPGDEGDEDGWNRASTLFATLTAKELLDWSEHDLLHRLFHEEGVEVVGRQALAFGCSCSRERVEAMLQALGRDEADAAVRDAGGTALVRCEFCGAQYTFDDTQIEALFTDAMVQTDGSARLH
ncbi:MAG: Hsp33 family molecular chaperone HslO [Pseudoxanthomonas suwonensis]|nr:Hsp33 family molecular chaperone HslO [Pseudoxanthomonas suwonensis]